MAKLCICMRASEFNLWLYLGFAIIRVSMSTDRTSSIYPGASYVAPTTDAESETDLRHFAFSLSMATFHVKQTEIRSTFSRRTYRLVACMVLANFFFTEPIIPPFDVVSEGCSPKCITLRSILQVSPRTQTIIRRTSTAHSSRRLCLPRARVMQRGSFEDRAARRNRRSIAARQVSYIRSSRARCRLTARGPRRAGVTRNRFASRLPRLVLPRVVVVVN